MAEYYRLNFQRKPEHLNIITGLGFWGVGFPTNNLFSSDEVNSRLAAWNQLSARVDAVEKQLPRELRDSFFELVAYPVKAAAAMNEKCLAGSQTAADEISPAHGHL